MQPKITFLLISLKRIWIGSLFFLLVLTSAQAQSPKMFTKEKSSIILDHLTELYDVNFIYDKNQVDGILIDSFVSTTNNLTKDLVQLADFGNLNFKKLNDKTYVIKAKEIKEESIRIKPVIIEEKNIDITGKVLDAKTREELIGVNIMASPTLGTVTGIDGGFFISAPEDAVLTFTYIGYQKKEVKVNGKNYLEVLLSNDTKLLDEVVVVGYGSQKRSDVTGSLSSISAEEIKQTAATGLDAAMQGRSAGVYVTQNSGAPGGGVSVRIRGTSSTLASEPLYVIDGIPVINDNAGTSTTFEADGGGQNANALTTINPNDIESIEILKDASATAIYGARAANGVVLITTIKGEEGTSRISYDTYYGFQQLYKKVGVMNLREYAQYINEVGIGNPIEEFANLDLLGEGTDWQNEIFRTAPMYNHQLTISGGNKKSTFSLSGGLHHKDGIVRGSNFDRYSLKLNATHKFSNRIQMGGNINVARTKENITFNDASGGVIYTALLTPPMIPARNLDGSFGVPPSRDVIITFDNPLANALETDDVNRKSRVLASVFGELDIFPWLKYRTELATDILFTNHNTFLSAFERGSQFRNSRVRRYNANSFFWINKHLLTFDKKFNDHNFNLLVGMEAQEGTYEWLNATRENLPNNELRELSLGDASTQLVNGGAGHWALLSYLGRLNYNYQDKYLLTSTFRVDGSSRFGPSNKYGYFPSFALAWRASNENFLKSIEPLSNLKFRIGYGSVGNQEIGLYSFATTLRSVDVVIADELTTGFAPDNISNPDVKWESSVQVDFGIDAGFFNNRLEIILDIYNKDSKDMLLPAILPRTAGSLNPPFVNIGKMNNRGFEITLNTQNTTGVFNWSTSMNYSVNRNKVVDLGSTGALTGIIQRIPITRTEEGRSIGEYYGHQVEGIFGSLAEIAESPVQETGTRPGDIKFKDLDNNGVIDDRDKTFIGNPNPDFTFNIINELGYKNFDFNIFFRVVSGNEVFNALKRDLTGTAGWLNQSVDVIDRWTVNNPDGINPRSNGNDPNINRRVSDRFVEDGSYIRLQNISLGYTMPKSIIEGMKIQSMRFYVSAQNLLTISGYSGFDPEIGSFNQNPLINGVDNGRFPVARSYTFGLNVNF